MLPQKEIDAMLLESADNRLKYSIKRIADFENVWVIGNSEGYGMLGDSDGNIVFPIWPFEDYASMCCTGEFEDHLAEAIDVHEFLKTNLPTYQSCDYKLSVFPLPLDKGMVIDIAVFIELLNRELDQYE